MFAHLMSQAEQPTHIYSTLYKGIEATKTIAVAVLLASRGHYTYEKK
ncbi:hypothetical protein GAGA_4011 [Paraglaciecola agarilytica NO2]|uniref:Uncharacterized protein n=1 Tax=Paraglaciecola agarilytica NO2 TaxID=1125747 RepID=A0ABQ0IBU5_9ALTE|nr:hypothetical protein GAGA_4011 [Paraglaciecola agarilytica NO2]